MECKLHAFVLIQAGRFGRKIVFETQPSLISQGKVGFLELCPSPLGCEDWANLVKWCMRKRQSLKAVRCARGVQAKRGWCRTLRP
jgi:hypothetical protein